MQFSPTKATHKIFSLRKRIRAVAGGTAASKTISILIWCIDRAQTAFKGDDEIITIVSESYPHLEKGAITDFKSIMKAQGYWNDSLWNETKHIYTFPHAIIEFQSVDTYGKAHGPRRDILFVNECNNLDYTIVDQLITRTRKIVWLDWNPTSEFWFYTDFYPNRKDDTDFITLTYLDNEALDETTIREIESHRQNKNWWKVYGLGELGEVEGRIYTDWAIIDEIPHEARLERRGLDFGYSQDPAALVDVYYLNGGYIIDERLYQRGLFNKDIADFIKNLENPQTLVKADSAEPKAIDEIRSYGVNILPVSKGSDSVNHGIQWVQSQRISVTSRSVNLIKEYRNYMWQTDKNGKIIKKPEKGKDHLLDATRYALEKHKVKKEVVYEPKPIFDFITGRQLS